MPHIRTNREDSPKPSPALPGPGGPARDAAGYAMFSAGEAGRAHVAAHRMLDSGRHAEGRRMLGEWLDGRTGAGSDWVHLHWHMAVFELELGDWHAAFTRFVERILPVASATEDALTDAPSLLWRLALSAPKRIELPWKRVRATALAALRRPASPYVQLHNLLALAGAGDVEGLDRWIAEREHAAGGRAEGLLARWAEALRAFVTGDHRRSAALVGSLLPFLREIGGSNGQNQLFERIRAASVRASGGAVEARPLGRAA